MLHRHPVREGDAGHRYHHAHQAHADEENYDQYLETYKLQELIKKYSDYIRYPIVMEVEDYRQKEKPADAGEDYKPEWETVKEWKTLNSWCPCGSGRRAK